MGCLSASLDSAFREVLGKVHDGLESVLRAWRCEPKLREVGVPFFRGPLKMLGASFGFASKAAKKGVHTIETTSQRPGKLAT